jgi:hypothetical protein
MINSKGGIMQDMAQTNPETDVLTDAELDSINGGSWIGKVIHAVGHFIVGALHGPGDLRPPTRQP